MFDLKKSIAGPQLLPGKTRFEEQEGWKEGRLMASLLPRSQAAEKDACVSLRLVKEQEVEIFTAQERRWTGAICLFAFAASLVVFLCFGDNVISPEATQH